MASLKQLKANKANAQKSTGPSTQAGKDRSRFNSRKHGLTAKLLVIGDEDPADFEELRAELMQQYDPRGSTECELVEYLAGLYWRLRRVPFFEAAVFAFRQAQVESDVGGEDPTCGEEPDGEAETEDADEAETISNAEWLVRVGRILVKDGIWGESSTDTKQPF
jgi:hypothetical protein